ncbi:MAG: hypothetical protein H8E48_01740 [Chloroflexi bacterium]|nr:hypothetical protein [Chloroflexota bacterium]
MNVMIDVSLTDFVDFLSRTGSAKVSKVKEIKSRGKYNPTHDFWRILREGIVDHGRNSKSSKLDMNELMSKVVSASKIDLFPSRIEGYNKFRNKKNVKWFEPPNSIWKNAGVSIRVNPELGFIIDGKLNVIKLYFKKEPLSKTKVDLTRSLMFDSLQIKDSQDVSFGVLDVQQGRLFKTPQSDSALLPLLKGEANSLEAIWNDI